MGTNIVGNGLSTGWDDGAPNDSYMQSYSPTVELSFLAIRRAVMLEMAQRARYKCKADL